MVDERSDRFRQKAGQLDYVLELIGATTLLDSLQCAAVGGVVCMTGILGGHWEIAGFRPMEHIPMGVRLSAYRGGAEDDAHQAMDGNRANGKMVVVV